MAEELATLVVRLEADNKKLLSKLEKSERKTKQWEKTTKRSTKNVNAAYRQLGAGVLIGVAALTALTVKTIKAGDEIQKLSIRTSASAEFLSRMRFAAERSGTSLEAVTKALRQMQKAATDANDGLKTYQRQFQKLGINTEKFVQLKPEQQFLVMAEAISKIKDPTVRTAVAMNTMGRAGTEMLQLMDGGPELMRELWKEADRLGETLSQETADSMAETADAMRNMEAATRAFSNELVKRLAPALSIVFNMLADVSTGKLFEAIFGRADVFGKLEDEINGLNDIIARNTAKLELSREGSFRWLEAQEEINNALKKRLELESRLKTLHEQLDDVLKPNDGGSKYNAPAGVLGDPTADPAGSEASEKIQKAIEKKIQALQTEADTYGQTRKEIELYKLALEGASQSQIERAAGLLEAIEGEKSFEEAVKASEEAVKKENEEYQAWLETLRSEGQQVYEDTRTEQENLASELERLDMLLGAGVISWDTYSRAAFNAWDEMEDKAEDAINKINEFAAEAARSMERSFSDFFFDAMNGNFDNLADSFLSTLQRMAADMAAAEVMTAIAGAGYGQTGKVDAGSILGTFFSFFRAEGGPVTAGQPYIVGEKGPELMVPSSSGTVVPNNELGGQSVTVNISTMDAKSFLGNLSTVRHEVANMVKQTQQTYNL